MSGAADRLLCDFCVAAPPTWRYPAQSFDLPGLPGRSVGDWAACPQCHAWLEAGDWTALAQRSAATYAVKYEVPAAQVLPFIRTLHGHFEAARLGAPMPHP